VTATLTLRHHRTEPTVPAPPPRGATILDVFHETSERRPNATALRHHDGTAWRSLTWVDYHQAVEEVAAGLRSLGLEAGDRVGILSANRVEWHIADLGILAAGLVSVPIYATSSASQVGYILADAGCRVCFVEDGQQLAKVVLRRGDTPTLQRVVMLGVLEGVDDGFVMPFAELRQAGASALAAGAPGLGQRLTELSPDGLATLVYTSGTTGPPKGAMLTHGNLMATLRSLTSLVQLSTGDRFLSFLPLSHITERCISHFGQIVSGGETWFARGLATIAEDLQTVRPTLFFAVPRVWEKFRAAVLESAATAPPPVRPLLHRYLALATKRGQGAPGWGTPTEQRLYGVLDASVGALVRKRLGLDRARILSSGAAAIHPDLLGWFHGLGLPVAEGYGQTEVSLCTSLNPIEDIHLGTVGKPIPGVEVRIARDGEILVRSGGVCAGYWGKPDASAELVDADGWLHSGDVGFVDDGGYLHVTGRKKDLIITSYGKNIAPAEIETALRYQPVVSQAVVVGDGRPYLTALLTIDSDAAAELIDGDVRGLTPEALAQEESIREAVEDAVTRVNATHSHAEGIRRWRLLPRDLTLADDELTPTLKVKRDRVTAEFADLIDEMYAETT